MSTLLSRTKMRTKARTKTIVAVVLTSPLFLTACTVTGMAGGMTGN